VTCPEGGVLREGPLGRGGQDGIEVGPAVRDDRPAVGDLSDRVVAERRVEGGPGLRVVGDLQDGHGMTGAPSSRGTAAEGDAVAEPVLDLAPGRA
jgi:hypothetical protein